MNKKVFFIILISALFLTSCARMPVKHTSAMETIEPYPGMPYGVVTAPGVPRVDVYHEVAPGETVWRISKMYDVNIESIVKANKLLDVNKLEKGQRLFISQAAPLRSVIPLFPSKKWSYIIIHHSATDVGNALSFDYVHSEKKRWKGLGYHFVIDNGSSGKEDGFIEVSPRWVNQEDGAHCSADSMNYKGIGICLVGNFNEETVSYKQKESLIFLVNKLKDYYGIPDSHILGHGQVKGASTDCPGKRFPWREFLSRLNP